jgi:hypothetical protein
MDSVNPWKQTTWYVFHHFTLKYLPEQQNQYIRFFKSFEHILPCEVCTNHYRYQLSRKDLSTENNINAQSIFGWTVTIHNNVNSTNQKKIWAIDEARQYYESQQIDTQMIKTMVLEYVKHNFKKGPLKTNNLLEMLDSIRYIYPEDEKRSKLLGMNMKPTRDNIRAWLITFLKIICDQI